jgi:hypothetical protein
MSEGYRWSKAECPSIFVSVAPGSGDAERLVAWVKIGAEEEGVPCQALEGSAEDALTLANLAAQGSHISVGVGVDRNRIVLQEAHMPQTMPVLSLEWNGSEMQLLRLIGSNAGRMVKRMPLRFAEDLVSTPPVQAAPELAPAEAETLPRYTDLDSGQLNRIIEEVLKQRGLS